MKLRLTHNSIRIRVQRTELSMFMKSGTIQDTVAFPDTKHFSFGLTSSDAEILTARYMEGHIEIEIPKSMASQWVNSDQVSIEALLPLSSGNQLHVLIEKDFPCEDRLDEDKSETFWELA